MLVGVLEPLRRLVHIIASVCHRQRPAGLDEPGQVEPLDILHRQDDALTEAECRVGGDHVGVVKLGGVADLSRGSGLRTPRRFARWPLTTLSTSSRPMSLFLAM